MRIWSNIIRNTYQERVHTPDLKMYSVPIWRSVDNKEKLLITAGVQGIDENLQDTLNEQYLTVLRYEVKVHLGSMHKYKEAMRYVKRF